MGALCCPILTCKQKPRGDECEVSPPSISNGDDQDTGVFQPLHPRMPLPELDTSWAPFISPHTVHHPLLEFLMQM